jgi:lipopolysaccharide biosynthesis protein
MELDPKLETPNHSNEVLVLEFKGFDQLPYKTGFEEINFET